MSDLRASGTRGRLLPTKERYATTGTRTVYRIPGLSGDSSTVGGSKPVMAIEGSPSGEPMARYAIAGETFFARKVGQGRVLITHPQWSLMGRGATLVQAEEDLRSEAGEVAKILGAKPPELLSKEATRLYRFALRIS